LSARSRELGRSTELVFSEEDLLEFAEASGDRNPMHLDDGFARRTPFGGRIVYGSLLALAALGCLPGEDLARVRSLDISFLGGIRIGEPVNATTRRSDRRRAWEVLLSGRGESLVRVVAGEVPVIEPSIARGAGLAGEYAAPAIATVARRWHAGALDAALAEALAWVSYVVGMELPGRDGLFTGATLSALHGTVRPAGGYSTGVRERDERTGRILAVGSFASHGGAAVTATIECFVLPPVPVLSGAVLLPRSLPSPSGRAVVVIGGSRGFGAATALALLGHGHQVHAVSSTGGAPVRELAESWAERLFVHRADAASPAELAHVGAVLADQGLPLHGLVLAAAPPPLPMRLTVGSAAALADYVAESVRLAAAPLGVFLPTLAEQGFALFCSSTAVTTPPREWPQYVAAKGALESLAGWTSAAFPRLRCVVARLPKMLTAMTNSPSLRLGAAAPETVACSLVDLLEGGELPAGLTVR